MSVRWRLIAMALLGLLVMTGCQNAPVVVDVSEARTLPDGTKVTVEGRVTSSADGTEEVRLVDRLFAGTSGDQGPLYDSWLVIRSVEIETFDFFTYPRGSSRFANSWWSDDYNVTGTMENGELHVESMELLLRNIERQWVADCNAFLAGTTDVLGECPPRWVEPPE